MIINQLLLSLGAIGLLTCVVSLLALHLLPTGYHPFRDPVSNYAVSRYGYLYRLQSFSSGICAACLLGWFARSGLTLPVVGIAALLLYSLSRLLIIFFPTDVTPPRTRTGVVHGILATFTFAGIAIAAGSLTPSLISLAVWSKAGGLLQSAALLTDVAAIAFIFMFSIRFFKPIVGLIERCIYLGLILWLAIVFSQLILTWVA